MPGAIRTVYLGQFEDARAERISAALTEAGIGLYAKRFGRITRFFFLGDWGVRLYVDASRADDVRRIVADLDAPSS